MNQLKKWFEEAEKHTKTFNFNKITFIIYKGFKITKKLNNYFIQDTRFTDIYSKVNNKDRKILDTFGFIKGVDLITYKRDILRNKRYVIRAEKFYEIKDRILKSDPKYNSKISNCVNNINKSLDLMFYYQTRINQFKIKYYGKDKKIEDQAINFEK